MSISQVNLQLNYDRDKKIKGKDSIVFQGSFNGKIVAVKRTELSRLDGTNGEKFKSQDGLEHDNILNFLGVEADGDFRFIILELASGSLRQVFDDEYKGPDLPPEKQVFQDIASGLKYIHGKDIVHGNLKPENILVSEDGIIKLTDFGLNMSDLESNKSSSANKANSYGLWIAPEILKMSSNEREKYTETFSIDIFSAGCILFAFLKRNSLYPHAFGNQDYEVSKNIINYDPVNLGQLEDRFYQSLISDMIKEESSERITADSLEERLMDKKDMPEIQTEKQEDQKTIYKPIKWTGQIKYDKKKLLGESNSTVYEGTYQSKKYAVKRVLIQVNDKNQQRECENQTILNHENILKIITVEEDEQQDFRFIVLEFCAGTLGQMIDKEKTFILHSDHQVMYEIANGLDFIHSQNIIHRDIKPDNILISELKYGKIKLGDFDRSKKMTINNKFSISSVSGTSSWMAPEIQECYDEKKECTFASDIFSAGCVFFVFITRDKKLGGIHPFGGKQDKINRNDHAEKTDYEKTKDFKRSDLYNMICKMIEHKPTDRICLSDVKQQLMAEMET